MLRDNKQLAAKANYLELKNKRLIKVMKAEKQEKHRGKKLNLLVEKDNNLQLCSFQEYKLLAILHIIKKRYKREKKRAIKEENIGKNREKGIHKYSIFTTKNITRKSVKEKRIRGTKKADKEAKKASITLKILLN